MIEPLVFLPGFMCDARLFGAQILQISGARAVTVAPVSGGERIEEIASGLLDQLPHRFALCGFSMGGVVALELVRRAPDRVTRLCLMSTDAQADTPQIAADREELIVGAKSGRFEEIMQRLIGTETLAPGPGRVPILNEVMAMAKDQGPELFERQMRALQRRADQQPALRHINVPTLIICGAHDQLTPVKRHRFMAEMIPSAELKVMEDAGHLPPLETPAEVTQALEEWLNIRVGLPYL
ncbi:MULTISPECIES: alpha/beta hydrolase [unclassified Ruegeria]|uniref:alpha/beta fold hydrolase n=1 Tax=unclassified Ruegeria TaxID=2625375 RepID=UPI001ADBF2E1|nr:alpha/beta hydrolase [Ruegeria sp. R8_1]MBO9414492.1 alpha/beta hydrolase [Ruegeria sp. R8_2]